MRIAYLVSLFLVVHLNADALADVTIFQSAQLGATGQNGGVTVTPDQYLGVRFQVITTMTANEVGGHFGINDPNAAGNKEIFAALIALPASDAFPPLPNALNGPSVLATTTFAVPYLTTNDVAAPISPTTLSPGWYALMFGSGKFGATAIAGAPMDNPLIGNPSFFSYAGGTTQRYFDNSFTNVRFFVADVSSPTPESGSFLVIGMGSFFILTRRRPFIPCKRSQS